MSKIVFWGKAARRMVAVLAFPRLRGYRDRAFGAEKRNPWKGQVALDRVLAEAIPSEGLDGRIEEMARFLDVLLDSYGWPSPKTLEEALAGVRP